MSELPSLAMSDQHSTNEYITSLCIEFHWQTLEKLREIRFSEHCRIMFYRRFSIKPCHVAWMYASNFSFLSHITRDQSQGSCEL